MIKIKKILFVTILTFLCIYLTTPLVSNIAEVRIRNQKIYTEVAESPEEQTKGLSNRKTIGKDQGMLFVFSTSSQPVFWMRDMYFDIDIIWLKKTSEPGYFLVSEVASELPAPKDLTQPSSQLPLYSPLSPVDMALEVPAGFSKQANIKPGQKVQVSYPGIFSFFRKF